MNYSEIIANVVMPFSISIIMLGIGFGIQLPKLKKEFTRPKAMLVGLACQMLLLPAIAFLLAFNTDLTPYAKVGLVLLASAPGGSSSNLITFMLKGRLELSVAMTTLNSFIVLFTIPLYTTIALNQFTGAEMEINLPVVQTLLEVFSKIIIPVSLGIWINYKKAKWIEPIKPSLRYILPAILLISFTLVLFVEDESGMNWHKDLFALLIPALILNFGAMIFAYITAVIVKINAKGRFTIAIEAGLQNSALAVFIAITILENQQIATVAILYSAFSFFSTYIIAYLLKRAYLHHSKN